MFNETSFNILFPNTEKCGMYVRYRFSDWSRNYSTISILLLLPLELPPTVGFGLSKMSSHFFLSTTNSLYLLTPALEDLFLLPLSIFSLVFPFFPSSSWGKIFLGILSSSILSRWPDQFIVCPFIHFTIFSPLLISSSSRFLRHFHSPFSYLGPYILLNIFISKISTACSSFSVNVYASAPYDTTGLISVLYNIILVALDKNRPLKRLIRLIFLCSKKTPWGWHPGTETTCQELYFIKCIC